MSFSSILQTTISGIMSGMLNYLVVAGIALVMAGMDMTNFGQGAYYVLGAYVCYSVTAHFGFAAGLIAATAATFLVGMVVEVPLLPLFGKDIIYILMFTMGVAYVISDLMVGIWSYTLISTKMPESLKGTIGFLGTKVPKYYLFIIVIAALIAGAFLIMFYKTRLGMHFRAIISDKQMVANLGINVRMLCSIMFALSTMLGGIAGALYSPISGLSPKDSLTVFGNVMLILFIGGRSSIMAAFPAAILVGLVNAFGAIFVPTYYLFLPSLLMVIVMFIRPQGLFVRRWQRCD